MLGVIEDYSQHNQGKEGIRVSEIAKTLDVSSPAVSRMLQRTGKEKICLQKGKQHQPKKYYG